MKKVKKKLLFIDSNILIGCASEDSDGLGVDILKKIIEKLNVSEVQLILPEVLKNEVLSGINEKFSNFINKIKISLEKSTDVKSTLLDDVIKVAKENAANKISSEKRKRLKLIDKIFKHKNTKLIKLTDQLIIKSIKRSLLKIPPSSGQPREVKGKSKSAYTRDQDCVIFESVKSFLMGKKKFDLIICSKDIDYLNSPSDKSLHKDIKKELEKICSSATLYTNPLELFEDEFDAEYTDEQVKELDESLSIIQNSDYWTNLTIDSNVSTIAEDLAYPVDISLNASILTTKKTCFHCGLVFEVKDENSFSPLYRLNQVQNLACPRCHSINY